MRFYFVKAALTIVLVCVVGGPASATESAATSAAKGTASIVADVVGFACLEGKRSRDKAVQMAMADAIQKGREYVVSLVEAKTTLEAGKPKAELVSAYANGTIRVIKEPIENWYKDPAMGECFEVQVQVEAVPNEEEMAKMVGTLPPDDPAAPLIVKVWTDRESYKEGDKFRVKLKSNKSFYGTVVYQDASGTRVQLLPNPYRKDNFFVGNRLYELPDAADKYELVVSPPFGGERVTVYASTEPVGELSTEPAGKVYLLTEGREQNERRSRSIKFAPKDAAGAPKAAEFFEATADLSTGH